MRRRALTLATVLPLIAAACGPGTSLTLTTADAAGTHTIKVGETVTVTLTNSLGVPGSSTTWTADTTNSTVLRRTGMNDPRAPSYSPGTQWPATFTFTAEQSGRADIVATSSATCEAMNPAYCHGPPPMTFHITVTG